MDGYKDQSPKDPFSETENEIWDEEAVSDAEELILAAIADEVPEPEPKKEERKSRISDTALTRRESFRVNRMLYLAKLREKAEELEGQTAEAQGDSKEAQEVMETEWLEDALLDAGIPESGETKASEPAEIKEPIFVKRRKPAPVSDTRSEKIRRIPAEETEAVKRIFAEETEPIEEIPEKEKKTKRGRKVLCGILYGFTGFLVFLISLAGLSARWAFNNWGEIDINEIIFQLQMPLEGTGNGMVGDFLLKALVPSVVVLAVYIILMILLKKGKKRLICACAFLAAVIVAGIAVQRMVWDRLELDRWLAGQNVKSSFIEDNYVNPTAVDIAFPEKKRNLIFIYLESMETTYADKASGGDFEKNLIPELTKLAQENEDFSGSEQILNGGISYVGTNFTSGALFGMATGLPLKSSIGWVNMDTQTSFFPQIVGLGDILKDEGYRQIFMCGSNASFGGRELFYEQHGDFEIRDYVYGQEQKWYPQDYFEFWGFEDEILFAKAKETLTELAGKDQPFNLSMLTVDTHFEDGYVCHLCRKEFGENQYANVMACSSRQVTQFVEWIQQQDFYEDTTIVLTGDHPTMDTDFCQEIDPDYQRKTYTAIINPPDDITSSGIWREYSTLDLFPTTLAAMGVKVSGDRLGLGVNLFSREKTLTEKFGSDTVDEELEKKSDFLEKIESVDSADYEALLERYRGHHTNALVIESYDPDKKKVIIRVDENTTSGILYDHFEVEYEEEGSKKTKTITLRRDPENNTSHYGVLDISSWKKPEGEIRVNLFTEDGMAYPIVASAYVNFKLMEDLSFAEYFDELSKHPEYTVFLAAKNDASSGITEEMQLALQKIGVQTVLRTAPQVSYYAIAYKGTAIENSSYESLRYDGVIKANHVPYTLESAGFFAGSKASILIDGIEYAPNTRGLNVVVYDSARGQVMDARCFDTSANPEEPETETETETEPEPEPVW